MSLLKIAVLDDDQLFLNDIIQCLRRTKLVDIVHHGQDSDSFIEAVKVKEVDALLLDVKLHGEKRNGIDVANILKKPTIFFTSARIEFTDKIETLKTSKEFPPVEEFNKSPDVERLKTILEKFIPRVRDYQKENKIFQSKNSLFVKTDIAKRDQIFISTIILISTPDKPEKPEKYEPRDKSIYLIDGSIIKAKNITIEDLLDELPETFIQINHSSVINTSTEIQLLDKDTIILKSIKKEINVSDLYAEQFFKIFPKFK
jgi:chemotaxis response regulator CheB